VQILPRLSVRYNKNFPIKSSVTVFNMSLHIFFVTFGYFVSLRIGYKSLSKSKYVRHLERTIESPIARSPKHRLKIMKCQIDQKYKKKFNPSNLLSFIGSYNIDFFSSMGHKNNFINSSKRLFF
jgi:hypothetical protein